MNISRFVYITFFVLIFSACKIGKVTNPDLLEMPDAYFNGSDTIRQASGISWNDYFKDTVLLELIEEGLTQNLEIKQAMARAEMARSGIRFARGLSLPVVSGIASTGIQRFGFYTMDGVGNYDANFSPYVTPEMQMARNIPDYLIGFQSSWEVDVWGKLKSKKKAALSRFLASIEGQNLIVTNIVADIAFYYYELLTVEKEISILEETNMLQERGLEVIRIQKEAGRVNELAVNQFEAQYYNFKALGEDAYRRKFDIQNQLNLLLGRYPEEIEIEPAVFEDEFQFGELALGNPENLMIRRPDIRQAELELVANKADVEAARKAFYPSLELSGMIGLQTFNSSMFLTPESLTFRLFGSLMAPIFNRSALKSSFEFSSASQQEAFYQYQQLLIQAYIEVYQQTFLIDNLQKKIQLKERELEALENAILNADRLFATGRANYLEVILARRKTLESQFELLDARKMKFQTYVNMYRALGGG